MAEIRIEVDGAEVVADLSSLAERLGGGLGPDWAGPAISMEIAAIEREWFLSQGEGTWPPLAASTITARANRWGYYSMAPAVGVGAPGPMLQWTRRLAESLGDPRGRGAGDAIIKMREDELEQGTAVPYAIYHQLGGGRIPKRPPVKELKSDDVRRLANVFEMFVMDGVGP